MRSIFNDSSGIVLERNFFGKILYQKVVFASAPEGLLA